MKFNSSIAYYQPCSSRTSPAISTLSTPPSYSLPIFLVSETTHCALIAPWMTLALRSKARLTSFLDDPHTGEFLHSQTTSNSLDSNFNNGENLFFGEFLFLVDRTGYCGCGDIGPDCCFTTRQPGTGERVSM